MICLLLIGVVVMAGGCGAQNMSENGEEVYISTSISYYFIIDYCSSKFGLNETAAYDFVVNITVESFERQCVDAAKHHVTWDCIENIINSINGNITDYVYLPPQIQILTALGVLCNDTRIKPECIVHYSQQYEEIQACAAAHTADIDAETTRGNLRTCLEIDVAFKCARDVISRCDVHTGQVMGDHLQLSIPPLCGLYSTIIVG